MRAGGPGALHGGGGTRGGACGARSAGHCGGLRGTETAAENPQPGEGERKNGSPDRGDAAGWRRLSGETAERRGAARPQPRGGLRVAPFIAPERAAAVPRAGGYARCPSARCPRPGA